MSGFESGSVSSKLCTSDLLYQDNGNIGVSSDDSRNYYGHSPLDDRGTS